jgi:hypothetical protein
MAYYVASEDRDEAYATGVDGAPHPEGCTGWAGEDAQGRPVPCLACHPGLPERLRRQRRRNRARAGLAPVR